MIKVDAVANAPAPRVWGILTDTTQWPLWGPSVSKVEHRGALLHKNSQGRIRLPFGLWLPFEVSTFQKGHYFSWRVAGVPATGHRVEALDDKRSRIIFEVPTIAAPYALICKKACYSIARLAEGES